MTTPNIPIGEGVNYPEENLRSPKMYRNSPIHRQISVGTFGNVGVTTVNKNGEPFDPTTLSAKIVFPDGRVDRVIDTFDKHDVGEFSFTIPVDITNNKQSFKVVWSYETSGVIVEFTEDVTIRDRMPNYDSFSDSEKAVVEQVHMMFADMFDSADGGAFLTEVFQSDFSFERIAQLMKFALNRINTGFPPFSMFFIGNGGVGSSGRFPEKYMSVLVIATYVEIIKHLMRSYVEIPEFKNMQTTYTDRRDYYNRWRQILKDEEDTLKDAVMFMKRDMMNLSYSALIVSGGMWGTTNGVFMPGAYSAQVRSFRFYPTLPIINTSFGR